MASRHQIRRREAFFLSRTDIVHSDSNLMVLMMDALELMRKLDATLPYELLYMYPTGEASRKDRRLSIRSSLNSPLTTNINHGFRGWIENLVWTPSKFRDEVDLESWSPGTINNWRRGRRRQMSSLYSVRSVARQCKGARTPKVRDKDFAGLDELDINALSNM